MYTVLIADDESNIREGLKHIIDWESLGFLICGETANGEDTLHFILEQSPQLVLLDIRMPKMYGTDIIRIAREKGYKGRFIILSGYSDFAYAQTAIRYGASFYLTKPIDEDELLQSITKIKEALEADSLLKSKTREITLHEIVTGEYHALPPSEKEARELTLSADSYQIVIYEKYDENSCDENFSFAELLKIANKENHEFEHIIENDKDVILLKGSFALHKYKELLNRCESSPSPFFLAYGRPVTALDEISFSYQDAVSLISRRFFCMQGQQTLGYEELPDVHKHSLEITNSLLTKYSEQLTGYLLAFNRPMVAETLSGLEEYLYQVKDSIASVKLFLTDLYLLIKEKINHTYQNSTISFPANAAVISHIGSCCQLYEIILYISEMTEQILKDTGNPSRDTVMDDIIYYINHNYEKNLRLEGIAPLFGYNSAYLGKIFNRHLGESFNSYVDRKRIERSMELLKEKNRKVYEISEQVGYKNVDYFHKKFKKHTGMSPAEYRKKL